MYIKVLRPSLKGLCDVFEAIHKMYKNSNLRIAIKSKETSSQFKPVRNSCSLKHVTKCMYT